MIDWVSCFLPCKHIPINSGCVVSINPDGSIEWQTNKRIEVEGSHSQKIHFKSYGSEDSEHASMLFFSGNPSKFLQGHNVFGSDDLRSLMYESFLNICRVFKLRPTEDDRRKVRAGDYKLTRVDINYPYQLPTRADVLAWLRAAEYNSKTRHGRSLRDGGTVYWGKHSRRWAIKAYCKGEELKKHPLPDDLVETPLKDWASNILRIEVVLRYKELEDNLINNASVWDQMLPSRLFKNYVERLEMTSQLALSTKEFNSLPHSLRTVYLLWQEGHDLRSNLKRSTYYRRRKDLLDYGINIDFPPIHTQKTNVVPLLRVLEASQASIPDWAFSMNLIHSSASQHSLKIAS